MTIREFSTTLRGLTPLSVAQLMDRYELSEAQAQDELQDSWHLVWRVPATAAVLEEPFPSPEQFSATCITQAFNLGNVGLNKEITDWGGGFWVIGGLLQEKLLVNQQDRRIYWADYDAFAAHDTAAYQPCARDFGSLLAALLCYGRYYRQFFTADADPLPHFSRNELRAQTLRASGLDEPTNILGALF